LPAIRSRATAREYWAACEKSGFSIWDIMEKFTT
jgi:hypothetical protein